MYFLPFFPNICVFMCLFVIFHSRNVRAQYVLMNDDDDDDDNFSPYS